jgi:hypothetical protein
MYNEKALGNISNPYEGDSLSALECFNLAVEAGGVYHAENFSVKVYEFLDVDPKFIDFVKREIVDYDHSKHSNFYIVD